MGKREEAMLAVIRKVYDCGKAKDKKGKLGRWTLMQHAEKALTDGGADGLYRYYENSLKNQKGQWVKSLLEEYGCPTLESMRAEFLAAYRAKPN